VHGAVLGGAGGFTVAVAATLAAVAGPFALAAVDAVAFPDAGAAADGDADAASFGFGVSDPRRHEAMRAMSATPTTNPPAAIDGRNHFGRGPRSALPAGATFSTTFA
jgi:hypothetical protein